MPLSALRIQIGSAINAIVQVSRFADGSRKITHITQVRGFDVETNNYITDDIFLRNVSGLGDKGEVISTLDATGVIPQATEQIRQHGYEIPECIYQAAEGR
jgi:pilus assembly protein CpaF